MQTLTMNKVFCLTGSGRKSSVDINLPTFFYNLNLISITIDIRFSSSFIKSGSSSIYKCFLVCRSADPNNVFKIPSHNDHQIVSSLRLGCRIIAIADWYDSFNSSEIFNSINEIPPHLSKARIFLLLLWLRVL